MKVSDKWVANRAGSIIPILQRRHTQSEMVKNVLNFSCGDPHPHHCQYLPAL